MSSIDPFTKYKDPNDVRDFTIDWSGALVGSDTITTSTWSAESGVTVVTSTKTNTTTTVWLSGGTDGEGYSVTNRIVTVGGRTLDQSLYVIVREN
jgi:hypothetical protein